MKQKVSLLFGLAIALVISSCGQRQYAHLTGINIGGKNQPQKEFKSSGHYVKDNVAVVETESTESSANMEEQKKMMPFEINHDSSMMVNVSNKEVVANNRLISDKKKVAEFGNVVSKPTTAPVDKQIKKVKKKVKKLSNKADGGDIIYWILVIILVLLILTLLKELLGSLYPILILAVLIVLLGHLLGWW